MPLFTQTLFFGNFSTFFFGRLIDFLCTKLSDEIEVDFNGCLLYTSDAADD